MKQPIILLTDDDPQVLAALKRDVKNQYRDDYRVLASDSPQETLDIAKELKAKDEIIALFISDQRMPVMEGVDLLASTREFFPDAKRILLTAYSDIHAAIKAINEVKLDYYLQKPWDPPEERLFPVMNELLEDWHISYRPAFKGIKLIGLQWSPKSHQLKDFLLGNLVPYQWLDVEMHDEAKQYLSSLDAGTDDLPVLLFEDGTHLSNPALGDVAVKIGLKPNATGEMYDVIIVGAGPAGLAAAVYGASEGLKTLVIEKRAPGGQAGGSSRIENYLGFPSGLSGSELTRRATAQVLKFGAEILSPREVKCIRLQNQLKTIVLDDNTVLNTKALVLTAGVVYRTLDVPGMESLLGAGIYYGAVGSEAHHLNGMPVYVVGGGNSAGQAAIYLSKFASKVSILIRGNDLKTTMSSYLIDQIRMTPNISVIPDTSVKEVIGTGKLESIMLRNEQTGNDTIAEAAALFVFIGAKPNTSWLPDEIIRDKRDFIITGRDLIYEMDFYKYWKLEREPYYLETSVPGIFAAGDLRSGAMARVASAVGEGSMSIRFTHDYLAEI
jgi:thioredoxin reductase (NADPH)